MKLNIDTTDIMIKVTILTIAILIHAPWWLFVMVFFCWFGLTFKKEI